MAARCGFTTFARLWPTRWISFTFVSAKSPMRWITRNCTAFSGRVYVVDRDEIHQRRRAAQTGQPLRIVQHARADCQCGEGAGRGPVADRIHRHGRLSRSGPAACRPSWWNTISPTRCIASSPNGTTARRCGRSTSDGSSLKPSGCAFSTAFSSCRSRTRTKPFARAPIGSARHVIPNGVDLEKIPRPSAVSAKDAGDFLCGFFPASSQLPGLRRTPHTDHAAGVGEVSARNAAGGSGAGPREALAQCPKGFGEPDATIPHLDPRIIIHGFVSDLLPLYETAHIVAVPLPLSAGTNIKVMEALACQRAVVTTPVGAQGLGLKNMSPTRSFAGWARSSPMRSAHLIENPGMATGLPGRGRATAETRFGWNAIARDALDAYSLLIRESRAQRAAGNGSQREQEEDSMKTNVAKVAGFSRVRKRGGRRDGLMWRGWAGQIIGIGKRYAASEDLS